MENIAKPRKKNVLLSNKTFFENQTLLINEGLQNCVDREVYPVEYIKQTTISDLKTSSGIKEYLAQQKQTKVIGIMGRGSIKRHSPQYKDAAFIGKKLAEEGYLILTGGGGGAMEAVHLGVWFAGRKDRELINALALLASESDSKPPKYYLPAKLIKKRYPRVMETANLSILTFIYGTTHANHFASAYATYFNNAIREETLITSAKDGVIFLPGGYGTLLELFIALEYNSDEIRTRANRPLILYNSKFWKRTLGPDLLKKIRLTDNIEDIVQWLSTTNSR